MSERPPPPAGIVFYDGACGFCQRGVRLVLNFDRAGRLRFAPLQGTTAAELEARLGVSFHAQESLSYWRAERELLNRSDATLAMLADLGGGWKLAALLRLIPRGLRDAVYNFIARHRYHWKSSCQLPTPAEAARFLP